MPAGWAAAAGAVASIAGGLLKGKGSSKSAKAQLKAARETNALQRYLYEQSRADLAPYRQTGYGALNAMNRVMGLQPVNTNINQVGYDGRSNVYGMSGYGANGYGVLGGQLPPETIAALQAQGFSMPENMPDLSAYGQQATAPQDRYGGFYESPGYQFAYDNAMKGAERAASAGGYLPTANGGASGRFSKEMARYSQGLASQEFGNYFNRLGVLAGVGQTATSEGNQLGANYGANAGNVMLAAGDARASGIIGKSDAWGDALQGVASAFGDYMKSRGKT